MMMMHVCTPFPASLGLFPTDFKSLVWGGREEEEEDCVWDGNSTAQFSIGCDTELYRFEISRRRVVSVCVLHAQ